jgi:hypothetical protein
MKFRFEFDIPKLAHPIQHSHRLFLIGSCFTENIGAKLKKNKFSVLENPHGILFNPVSVSEAIIDYVEHKEFKETDIFNLNEGWHSWKHHSRLSGINSEQALGNINKSIGNASEFLKHADFIFITLGSAWVYTLTENAPAAIPGSVAANNHKAPADWFYRKLLSIEDILSTLDEMIHRLFLFNSSIQIIFTISPVRHLREGAIENNRSKAALIQAVHQLKDKFENIYYFPAYELVLDDLRDYRFYAEDLVHPNYFATQYVWEKLVEACMAADAKKLMEEIAAVNLAFNHKAFNPDSDQHKKFLSSFYNKTKVLQEQYPYLDFSKEMNYFKPPSPLKGA